MRGRVWLHNHAYRSLLYLLKPSTYSRAVPRLVAPATSNERPEIPAVNTSLSIDEDSVSQWLTQLGDDEPEVAEHKLFQRYFRQLVALASEKLRGTAGASRDAEDVALSALDSFFARFQRGDFMNLSDRTQLWALLVTITMRKAINRIEYQQASKRGSGMVYCESDISGKGKDASFSVLTRIASKEPTPDMVAELAEQCRRRLDLLPDQRLRTIARMKLDGYSNAEIARELGIGRRTVDRKLYRIRREWMEAQVP